MSTHRTLSRRAFISKSGKTMASLTAASLAAGPITRSVKANVRGANDRINIAVVGIRGRGQNHMASFGALPNVHVKTLCDIDENLFPERTQAMQDKFGYTPATEWDMKKVFDDKDIDAVSFATPNHWHALGTIWALQAGKHVYVEKPCSHEIWEGRKMVEAARKHNKIVQVGFQNRSKPEVIQAMKFLHEGKLGKIYMARGLCFKSRHNIGTYPDSTAPAGVHYDRWLGPAPLRPFNKNRFHYNWHWNWDYGNGDIGNQGPHQFDVARWGLNKNEHPVNIRSMGGCYIWENCAQQTANTQVALYTYSDGTMLQFEVRGLATNKEDPLFGKHMCIGNLFFGADGWMVIYGHKWKTYFGKNNEPGPSWETYSKNEPSKNVEENPADLTGGAGENIFGNFIDAVRANDRSVLTSEMESGFMSTCLPHLANISYRLNRDLKFDGANERFIGDDQANTMLTRKYREHYIVPENV